MTVEDKRKVLSEFCSNKVSCENCPLEESNEKHGFCYSEPLDDEIVIENFAIVFPNDVVEEEEDPVNRPSHYTDGKIEVIDFIEDKKLGFCLGNAIKYIARAGKKDPTKEREDIAKAIWYLNRYLKELEEV